MTFTPDGTAPPGIPLLGCSPHHHGEVQVGLWGAYMSYVWAKKTFLFRETTACRYQSFT